MAEPKTRRTGASVETFLSGVADDARRADCRTLVGLMRRATGSPAAMWGPSMVGFGSYHFRYESGREGDWFLTGFSPRKQDLTLYIMSGFTRHADLVARLGRIRTGKACLYLKRLSDVDLQVLEQLVRESVAHMRKRHPRDDTRPGRRGPAGKGATRMGTARKSGAETGGRRQAAARKSAVGRGPAKSR